MLENLRIALKRQKKLLLIFLIFVLLPSISLAVFGIRAIKSERFRLAKQLENEHRRAAESLKIQVDSRIKDIQLFVQNLATHPFFAARDISALVDLVRNRREENPFVEQVFIFYAGSETLFPLFRKPVVGQAAQQADIMNRSQMSVLKQAEDEEFIKKNFGRARSLYNQLFSASNNRVFKARMLISSARCSMKQKEHAKAIDEYSRLQRDYAEAKSKSGMPLNIIAGLQIIEGYMSLGDQSNALKAAFSLYGEFHREPTNLTGDQFRTYSGFVDETITEILAGSPKGLDAEEFRKEYQRFKDFHQQMEDKWKIHDNIEREIIPAIVNRFSRSNPGSSPNFNEAKVIDDRDYLTVVSLIPADSGKNSFGFVGALVDDEYFRNEILQNFVTDIRSGTDSNAVISRISGTPLIGSQDPNIQVPTITEFFEENYPPWKIEFFRSQKESVGILDIRKSFYFWTVLTLIVILTFGAVLIVRTISHEIEILKIKSDFVSSVSHELKTPLTSIKALMERLREGRVKNPSKMQEYFSVISHETDKLTGLVRNLLDFSKIEEGKKEYEFQDTDIGRFVTLEVESFCRDEFRKGIKIRVNAAENIPTFPVDRTALSLALQNLLDNAVKFSQAGKEMRVDVSYKEGNIIARVMDNGIGIPSDEIDKIFDKFYQGKNALRLTVKGTGLGLALVKHIVEAHGGRVSVESRVNRGSTFSLVFPIEKKRK